MKGARDKTLLMVLGIAALLFLFYFAVLAPKREKASALGDEITELESSIDQQQQVTQFAQEAREEFPRDYGQLVGLGKAVPEQADQASMLVQVNSLANRAGVDFRGFEIASNGGGSGTEAGGATAGSTAPTPAPGTESSGGSTPPSTEAAPPSGDTGSTGATPASTDATATAAPATETAAANLPIGAVVGPAGLPTLPYDVVMKGDFFGVANFMGGVDRLVVVRESNGLISSNGRLMTVNGFALSSPTAEPVPKLQVDFALTSYVVPAEQGLTAGASPGGPAPAPTTPETTPASSTVAP